MSTRTAAEIERDRAIARDARITHNEIAAVQFEMAEAPTPAARTEILLAAGARARAKIAEMNRAAARTI